MLLNACETGCHLNGRTAAVQGFSFDLGASSLVLVQVTLSK
jgi:hypothetical protein